MGADVFLSQLQSLRATSAGALECHMFEEVSGSVGCIRFCAGTSINPNTNGSCFSMRVRLSRYG